MLHIITKCFLAGWAILLIAILLNYICNQLKVSTWYDFLLHWGEHGIQDAWASLNWISLLYLLLIYPVVLGVSGYLMFKWLS